MKKISFFFIISLNSTLVFSAHLWVTAYLMIKNNQSPSKTRSQRHPPQEGRAFLARENKLNFMSIAEQELYRQDYTLLYEKYGYVLNTREIKKLKKNIKSIFSSKRSLTNCFQQQNKSRKEQEHRKNQVMRENHDLIENLNNFFNEYFQFNEKWKSYEKPNYSLNSAQNFENEHKCHIMAHRYESSYKLLPLILTQ